LSSDSKLTKFALWITYDGTQTCGWQKQRGTAASGGPSVQEAIEKALHQISGESPSVVGSGRTDAGVHASGQVAHFCLREKDWGVEKFRLALNSTLPPWVRIREVREVRIEFHAQRSALKKQYSYYILQSKAPIPHLAPYAWWVRRSLDRDRMGEAISYLKGKHDFAVFQASGAKPGPTDRTIFEADVTTVTPKFPDFGPQLELIRIRVVGSGFLKQMVRAIAGTLIEIGQGKHDVSHFDLLIQSKDRSFLGATAKPRGLWLERVWYSEVDFF